ncbi:MAG: FCD domain-containing protein [Arenicellales bacterium]
MNDTLQVTSGSAGVFNKIRDSIVNGRYSYNERLPSERDLATRYKAARGTIRSALEQLEQASMVRRKFGSGTFVTYKNDFDHEDIAEETSPLELIEARLAIEPYIVKLVVLNANNRDLNRLEQALEQANNTDHDPEAFSQADEAFQLMLATCSQNPLLIWIYQRINDIRSHNQWSARKANILTPLKIRAYNEQHRQLLEAIRHRDQIEASDIISSHLKQARQDITGVG